ncbi:MAG: rhodanese-like domain-containing protein, partial [Turicibacter sp.]|nr:rhodanese-like domain-containing protein [Turicibacter sp.]
MKMLIGKVILCFAFISLMSLAILEYEKVETVSGQIASEFPSIQYISQGEAEELIKSRKGVIIIDVRNNNDYIQSHLENAVNIPLREMNEHLKELEQYKENPIILYCSKGNRSKVAAIQLEALGYKN